MRAALRGLCALPLGVDAAEGEREGHARGQQGAAQDEQRHAQAAHQAGGQLERGVHVRVHRRAVEVAGEIGGHLGGVGVTRRGLDGGRLLDDVAQLAGSARGPQRRSIDGHRPVTEHVERLLGGAHGEQPLPAHQLVKDGAERPHVAAPIGELATRLLRAHVGGRAEHPRVGERRRRDGAVGDERGRGVLVDEAGQPPVHQLGLAEGPDHDVGGLEVAVDDAVIVGVGDGLAHRQEVAQQRHAIREPRRLVERVGERAAVDQAHGVVEAAVVADAGVVERHDGGVLEPGGDPRLARQPPREHGVIAVERDALERHVAAQPPIVGHHHLAHAAAPRHLDGVIALVAIDAERVRLVALAAAMVSVPEYAARPAIAPAGGRQGPTHRRGDGRVRRTGGVDRSR